MTAEEYTNLSEERAVRLLQKCAEHLKHDITVTSSYARNAFILSSDTVYFLARPNVKKVPLGDVFGWSSDPVIYNIEAEKFFEFCDSIRGDMLGEDLGVL